MEYAEIVERAEDGKHDCRVMNADGVETKKCNITPLPPRSPKAGGCWNKLDVDAFRVSGRPYDVHGLFHRASGILRWTHVPQGTFWRINSAQTATCAKELFTGKPICRVVSAGFL
jgi:hypothetical protein